jgi:hypothetical protein
LYNAPYIQKDKLKKLWGSIVGEPQPFTRIELVRKYKQLCSYAAKYVAKAEDGSGFNINAYLRANNLPDGTEVASPGRVWGVWNRNSLPYDELIEDTIPLDNSIWIIRAYCAKFYGAILDYPGSGFTVFMDDPYGAMAYCLKQSREFRSIQKQSALDN